MTYTYKDISFNRDRQEKVFHATSNYLMDMVRKLNKISSDENDGSLNIPNYNLVWNDGRVRKEILFYYPTTLILTQSMGKLFCCSDSPIMTRVLLTRRF